MFRTAVLTLGLVACGGNQVSTDPLDLADGLGEWSNTDLTCLNDADCLTGEVCGQGLCQIERCASSLATAPAPLGDGIVFFQENELAYADTSKYEGSFWVDAYRPERTGSYDHSWDVGGAAVIDITGGNFDGGRTELYAVANRGSTRIKLAGTTIAIDAGFEPVAIDSGDVDGDGLDEIIAIAAQDELAICHIDTNSCDLWSFDDNTPQVDVAVGDIDGDSFEEITILLDIGGDMFAYGFNSHAEQTGETATYWSQLDPGPNRITAADLDGDWVAEVIGLVDPWWCIGWCDDEVHVLDASLSDPESGRYTERFWNDVNGMTGAVDLVAGDTDHDDIAEVMVLEDDAVVQLMRSNGGTALNKGFEATLDVSSNPDRLAMADHDGDAPRAMLNNGPSRVDGNIVPTMVMVIPPYDRDHSDGEPFAAYGDSESVSEEYSDSLSMGLNADIGTNPSFFGLFGTKLSAKVSYRMTNIVGNSTKITVGSRYIVDAEPDLFGPNYGAVVLSWGCFDAYEYEVDDPNNYLGGADDEPLVVTMPVGGGEAMYSSTRYNAMASATGSMPVIEIPYTVGDVWSYPTEATRLKNGKSLPQDAMLFPEPESYVVSDVGKVLWWNVVGESNSNTTLTDYSFGASAGVTAFGVTVGGGADYGWGNGYSLTVGTDAAFIGGLPPIPDDPSTPEDEYASYGYRVTPHVYQETWKTPEGEQAGYYVMTYSVGE